MSLTKHQTEQVIRRARDGSPADLAALARGWILFPDPLVHKVPSIFFDHLNKSDVPTNIKMDPLDIWARDQPPVSSPYFRAFWSICGITHLLESAFLDRYENDFIRAWPGIFKWSAFFVASRVKTNTLGRKPRHKVDRSTFRVRSMTRDAIAGTWYAAFRSDAIRQVMIETLGFLEVVVALWVHEDDYKLDDMPPETTPDPTPLFSTQHLPSILLHCFLTTTEGDLVEKLFSMVRDIPQAARIVTRRLGDALKGSKLLPYECAVLLQLMLHFSWQEPQLGLFEAIMNHGAAILCTKLLVKVASCIQSSYPERHPDLESLLVLGFMCIQRLTQATNSISWIIQVVNAGILSAFVESSPVFRHLTRSDYTAVSAILLETIPTYLCYRSVVHAVDTALQNLERTDQLASLPTSRAWRLFKDLTKLTAERKALVTLRVKPLKRDKSTKCGNGECEIIDAQNNFRRCGNCLSCFYCSKECQIAHWKSGHKLCCEGRRNLGDGATSHRNMEYITRVNQREVLRYTPYLKTLAARQYPGIPLQDLVICINHRQSPVTPMLRSKSEIPPKAFTPPADLHRPGQGPCFILISTLPHKDEAHISYYDTDIWTVLSRDEMEPPPELDPTGSRYIDLVEISGLENWREYWAGIGVDVEAD
ncbi:hypothetical protein BDN72DRAFT_963158 [Pluteus cervinus]|uniref:Uncharacterized protein n=1 Tax=Pluteus cervinus TaxID=181527 RepID=A0ACD3AFG1_9AGAR|nr:hypothetical protein BDN72DRAFT_963158 [Pluteus cervinus]